MINPIPEIVIIYIFIILSNYIIFSIDKVPRPISNGSITVNIESKANNNNLTLSWEDLNVFVPETKETFFKKSKQNCEKLHIVQNVYGIAKPGQILAIMGASGAGHFI